MEWMNQRNRAVQNFLGCLDFWKDPKIVSMVIFGGLFLSPSLVREKVIFIYLSTQRLNYSCNGISFKIRLNNHSHKDVSD